MKIIQISDTHLLADKQGVVKGQNSLTNFTACLTHIKKNHADLSLLLATGDLSQDGSTESYQYWLEQTAAFNVPIRVIPGNHDNLNNMQSQFPAEMLALSTQLADAWRLIQLNSTLEDQVAGQLNDTELMRLAQSLNQNTDQSILISLHHPPVTTNSHWLNQILLKNPNQFFQQLENSPCFSQIKAIVFGHIHQDFYSRYKHIDLYATPSTCVQFAQTSDSFKLDEKPPGYRCLLLNEDGTVQAESVYLDADYTGT